MARTTNLKGFFGLGLFPFLSLGCWFSVGLHKASAQIIPDNTLGAESSRLTNVIDSRELIEGGASRGTALFHSFLQFNVGEGQRVYFANPIGIKNIFSRVTGSDPSAILGTLGVNGGASLFLLNPNGIIFGQNAQLDIRGSFVASTANSLVFENGVEFSATNPAEAPLLTINVTPGLQYGIQPPAAVVNAGNLAVGKGASLTLVGGTVVSSGDLSAPGGKISLVAVPGNSLVQLEPLTWQQLPTTGDSGVGNGALSVAELVTEAGLGGTGIPVDVNPGTVAVSGLVDVSNGEGIGGIVQVLGDRVGLFDAGINANGRDGGGTVLIGGDYQGLGIAPNASRTSVSSNSVVNADALVNGDGGKVIVWADETADIDGTFTARGGRVSGNGGFIETSSKQFLNLTSTPDASALNGNGGTWLIDPTNITIANSGGAIGTNRVNVANINAVLNTGTNVTIATNIGGSEQGNITQNADAPINKISGGNATLTLQADNNIVLNGDITSSSGNLNINLLADRDNSGIGAISIFGATINTNGGNLSGSGRGSVNLNSGVKLENSNINTGNGNITLTGQGATIEDLGIGIDILNTTISSEDGDITLIGNGKGSTNGVGINISNGSLIRSTGTGNITVAGTGARGTDGNAGIFIHLGSRVSSRNGNINLTGTSNGTDFNNDGISIIMGSIVEATESGNITLIGTGGAGNDDNEGIAVGGSVRGSEARVSSVNGNISFTGNSRGTGNHNIGIFVFEGGLVRSTGAGRIIFQGRGSGSGSNNHGIFLTDLNPGGTPILRSVVESIGTGDITLEGTSSAGFSDNQGIQISGVDVRVSSADGNITLRGTAALRESFCDN